MKYNYYYAPIFGKVGNRNVCYFYITKWLDGNIKEPVEEHWEIVNFPISLDYNHRESLRIPKEILSAMLLYQYLSKYEFVSDRILGKVYDVTLQGKLALGMSFLKRFREFEQGNMNPKAIQDHPKRLPMIKKLTKTPEYDMICAMRPEEFYFMTNIMYETGLVQKVFKLTSTKTANLLVKYEDIMSVTEKALAEYTLKLAHERIQNAKYYENSKITQFSEFMKP